MKCNDELTKYFNLSLQSFYMTTENIRLYIDKEKFNKLVQQIFKNWFHKKYFIAFGQAELDEEQTYKENVNGHTTDSKDYSETKKIGKTVKRKKLERLWD